VPILKLPNYKASQQVAKLLLKTDDLNAHRCFISLFPFT